MTILDDIRNKKDINKIVRELCNSPAEIELLIKTIKSDKSAVKFGCEKALRLLSEQRPELIYPYFDFFAEMLDYENSFLKWGAILTIANLTAVDSDKKFDSLFKRYYSFIKGGQMIAANNVIGCSVVIAANKPELADRIAAEILKAETAEYLNKGEKSSECRNIACGAAIAAFDELFPWLENPQEVLAFVERQLGNSRPKVSKAAEQFLKKHG